MEKYKRLWLAVDFDGTIVTEGFPKIGEIKQKTVDFLKLAKEKGHNIIIWTARSGQYEVDAKNFLIENNIPFDYINENPEDPFHQRGEQGRKLFANFYIDDRAIHVDDIDKLFNVLNGVENLVGRKAILRSQFYLAESCDGDLEFHDIDDQVHFREGLEVEIIKEVKSDNNFRLFIIYSEELNEATVVSDRMLFILKEEK